MTAVDPAWAESERRVCDRAQAALDVLAFACEWDHGELDFDDPRRSLEAVEEAALDLIAHHGMEDAVQMLANIAANTFRCLVGTEDLGRIREALAQQRASWVPRTPA